MNNDDGLTSIRIEKLRELETRLKDAEEALRKITVNVLIHSAQRIARAYFEKHMKYIRQGGYFGVEGK